MPIGLAALSPASIRLAGELADAWAPFLWARSRLPEGRALLDEGEARAEAPTATRVTVGVPVALGPDAAGARRLAAWWLSTYATRMGPLYPRMLGERFGMAAGLDAVVAAADGTAGPSCPRSPRSSRARSRSWRATTSAGEAIGAWFAAGADSVQLVLPPGRPEEELAEIVEVAAARRRGAPRRTAQGTMTLRGSGRSSCGAWP